MNVIQHTSGPGTGMGWLPDRPDIRDYTEETNGIASLVARTGALKAPTLPQKHDLRPHCSPVVDQADIGSCTANAAAGIVEYFQLRAAQKYIAVSRMFLYKATRNLLQWTGDTGAYLRTTMGALRLFGTPPERYWPYDTAQFDAEPSAFCYSFAEQFQALQYYRLDTPSRPPGDLLHDIKSHVYAGLPPMFGFTVYGSIFQADNGDIPFPTPNENVVGGHAVVVVGFDDSRVVTNPIDSSTTSGAFVIRNSWGPGWGDSGYGYLPYQYVLDSLAEDFWVLVSAEYLETGVFDA
ncbi:C1 family peptidase [Streptomyces chryseus]